MGGRESKPKKDAEVKKNVAPNPPQKNAPVKKVEPPSANPAPVVQQQPEPQPQPAPQPKPSGKIVAENGVKHLKMVLVGDT